MNGTLNLTFYLIENKKNISYTRWMSYNYTQQITLRYDSAKYL